MRCSTLPLQHRSLLRPFAGVVGWFVFCFFAVFLSFPSRTMAIKATWELTFGPRFNWDHMTLNNSGDALTFDETLVAGSLLAGFETEVEWNDFVHSKLRIDLGELLVGQRKNSTRDAFRVEWNNTILHPAQTETPVNLGDVLLRESFLIREVYTHFYFAKDQWIGIRAGIMNLSLGRAALYDNYALGIRFLMDLSERESAALPFRLKVDAFLPDSSFTSAGKKSPVIHTSFEYVFDDEHSAGISFAYMYDGDSLGGQLLYPVMRDSILAGLARQYNQRYNPDIDFNCLTEPQAPTNTDDPYKVAKVSHQKAYDELQQCESGATKCDEKKIASLRSVLAVPAEIDGMSALAKAQQERGSIPAGAPLPRTHFLNACSGRMESQGHHFWVGVEGAFKWKNLKIEGSAHLYYSKMLLILSREPQARPPNFLDRTLPPALRERLNRVGQQSQSLVTQQVNQEPPETIVNDMPLTGLGFGGQLKITYDWHPMFASSLFFVFLSGDNVKVKEGSTVNAFMGIAPQLRYTNIFFNGGINAQSSQRNISIAGLTGRGVIAPGFVLRFHIDQKVTASKKKKKANQKKAKKQLKKKSTTTQKKKAGKAEKEEEEEEEEEEEKPAAKTDAKKTKTTDGTAKSSPSKTKPANEAKLSVLPPALRKATSQVKATSTPKPATSKKKKAEEEEEEEEEDEEEAEEDDTETVSVVEVILKGAPLWSQALPLVSFQKGLRPGTFYGFEVDLEATYRITPWMSAAFELDFFFPGNFFAESRPPSFFLTLLVGLNFKFQ